MAQTLPNSITFQDLLNENIPAIGRRIKQAKKEEQFDKFFDHVAWEKGHKVMTYRRLIYPKLTIPKNADGTVNIAAWQSKELVAPAPTDVKYATYSVTVHDYRDKTYYSADLDRYAVDDVVADAGDTLRYTFAQKLDTIKGAAMVKSSCVITPYSETVNQTTVYSVIKTMKKARRILIHNHAKAPFEMVCTQEIYDKLEDELAAMGFNGLTETAKGELLQDTVGRKFGFTITMVDSDVLRGFKVGEGASAVDAHMIVFLGRTFDGHKPLKAYGMGEVQVFNNAPGTSVLMDVNGHLTSDDNHQKGSIAVNALGNAAGIVDDFAILNCKFPTSDFDYTDNGGVDEYGTPSAYSDYIDEDHGITIAGGTNVSPDADGNPAEIVGE